MNELATKSTLRTIAKNRLAANAEQRPLKSSLIWDRLFSLDAFKNAWMKNRLMIYLDFDCEVQTTPFLVGFLGITPQTSDSRQTVTVPYCDGEEIVPVAIGAMDDLEPGRFGILEPKSEIRADLERRVSSREIDFVLVPGLAFDVSGNRLGRGKGFYDRFLVRLCPGSTVASLAFECQIFENIPSQPHDRKVDLIVTENRIITP